MFSHLFIWMQAWQCSPEKELSWNMLSLFTESGMLFLEVSLLAFLLQGNHAGGLDVLTRTFVISAVIVAADTLLKVTNDAKRLLITLAINVLDRVASPVPLFCFC